MPFRIISGEARTVDHKEEEDWHELVTKSICVDYKLWNIFNADETDPFFRIFQNEILSLEMMTVSAVKYKKTQYYVMF